MPNSGWLFQELENSIQIISPNGFTFDFEGKKEVLDVLGRLLLNGVHIYTKSDCLYIQQDTDDIMVFYVDKWLNPSFNYGDVICDRHVLAYVIIEWLREALDA